MAVRMLFSFGFILFLGLAFGENGADTGTASEPGGSGFGRVANKTTELLKDHPVIAAAAVGIVAGPVAVPLMVNAVGFGSAGIAAGSWAASWMSSYGGAVAAKSAFAVLQSVGAVGLTTKGIAAASAVGGTATTLLAKMVIKIRPGSEGEQDHNKAGEQAAAGTSEGEEDHTKAGEQAAEGQVKEDLIKCCVEALIKTRPAICEEQIKAGERAAGTQEDM